VCGGGRTPDGTKKFGEKLMARIILGSILVLSVLAVGMGFAGDIVYVDANAPPGGDGLTWETAFIYLQDALDVVEDGSAIWLADGTYNPDTNSTYSDGSGLREATFQLKNGVGLYGGYAGYGSSDPNERDIELYETILSGDLDANDTQGLDPCDLWDDPSRADNSYHVVTALFLNETAVLDGCTITGGNSNRIGGGMLCGDVYDSYPSSPTVSNCTFVGNAANRDGGALSLCYGPVTNCNFIGNFAGDDGGALHWCYGAIKNCIIRGNWANQKGGGLYKCNGAIVDCIITGNTAGWGGGIGYQSSGAVTNCTITNNSHGGLYSCSEPITNCILWGNTDGGYTGESAQFDGYPGLVSFSCIQDDDPNDEYIPFGGEESHNIDDYPLFVHEPNDGGDGWGVGDNDDYGDLHLQMGSPCINAGNPAVIFGPESKDMDGQRRVMAGVVDMGAYEFELRVLKIIRPVQGDVWAGGSLHEILWDDYGSHETVDILFSSDGGDNWEAILSGEAGAGSYLWNVPDIVDSNRCLIKAVPSIPDANAVSLKSGLFTIHPDSPGPAVESKWKSLGGDYNRVGMSEDSGPDLGCLKWQFDVNGMISASVTVGADETVYVPCEDGNLYTLDANGAVLWSYGAGTALISAASLGADGTAYVGGENGRLYSIDIDGKLRWTFTTDGFVYSSPAVSADGKIYVCSSEGDVYCLGRDGSELWNFETKGREVVGGAIFSSPAVAADGSVYFTGYNDSNLYSLDGNDGGVNWVCHFDSNGWCVASPVIGPDGTIYQTLLFDPNLYAIEPNSGTVKWSLHLADGGHDPDGWTEAAVGPDGTIYVSFNDPNLWAVDPNGSIKWLTRLGGDGAFQVSVGSNGFIYAAGEDGYLCVVDPNGQEIGRFAGDAALMAPVISSDGAVIVSDADRVWAVSSYGCEGQAYSLHRAEDLDGSGIINFVDFALLAENWLGCTYPEAPCNYSGQDWYYAGDVDRDFYVGYTDLAALAQRWLTEY